MYKYLIMCGACIIYVQAYCLVGRFSWSAMNLWSLFRSHFLVLVNLTAEQREVKRLKSSIGI
jgi:hypothetical protein